MLGELLLIKLLNRFSRSHRRVPHGGLLLGFARDAHGPTVPVRMPLADRFQHVMVLGKTGAGKTHFLQVLAHQHLQRREGFALFDFHGDCVATLLQLAARFPEANDRLVLVDPTDRDTSPGINPLETRGEDAHELFRRVSELAMILRARWSVDAFGPRSEELLRNVLYTLAAHRLTLIEAPRLLTSEPFRTGLTLNLPNQDIAAYWQERFEPLSEAMKATFREPLLNKITGFLTEPSNRHVLGQRQGTVDFQDAMAKGRWVLVNLSKGILREHAHTLGNLIFAKLQFDVFGRVRMPEAERRLFSIIVDEVQNLGENDLVTLLTEGRKFGVGLITANQYWDQVSRSLRGALLAAGTLVSFRVSAADAAVLASELSPKARQRYLAELTSLERGEAIARIGSEPPLRIRVPPLPDRSIGSTHAAESLRTLSLRTYARTREAIEADILRRAATAPRAPDQPRPNNHVSDDEGQQNW